MNTTQISTLLCGGALALSLAFPITPARAAEPTLPVAAENEAQNALASTQWELISPIYAGLKDKPTLKFDKESLGASVGLNQIGGGYTIDGKTIKISPLRSTRMAGPPAQMQAEAQYSVALQNARTFELATDGQTLTLRGATDLTFARAGQKVTNPLASTQWQLTAPVYAGLDKKPTLNFTDESVGASVGLNGMGAGYELDGSKIKIEQFISTMMAGPPALMDAENSYKKALAATRSFQLSRDAKTLILWGTQTLTFSLAGTTQPGFVATETKIINVAPQLGPQMDGDETPKYLQLEDLSEGVSWGRFTEAEILGFDYQPGNRYQLRVQVERDAQSGAKRLRSLEVFSQQYMNTAELGADDKILEVAPTKVDCMGIAPMKCLSVREVGGDWQNFYSPIEGFDFVEGYRYRLQVNVTTIENPPADGSSLRYKLVRVLDKMPVTF